MRIFLFLILLFVGPAEAAEGLVHKGVIREGLHCVKPGHGYVAEVCFSHTIEWKMWALMGEPVEEYHLRWKLAGYTLTRPSENVEDGPVANLAKLTPSWALGPMKPAFDQGFATAELYVEAEAPLLSASGKETGALRRFNTGVGVRQGQASLNVPGSPDWKSFFRTKKGCDKGADYLPAGAAKAAFMAGVHLGSLTYCNGTAIYELDAVEKIAGNFCRAPSQGPKPSFCEVPTPPGKKGRPPESGGTQEKTRAVKEDILDEGVDASIVSRRFAEERERFRAAAAAQCKDFRKAIDACMERQQCPRPKVPAGLEAKDCDQARWVPNFSDVLVLTREERYDDCDEDCKERRRAKWREERAASNAAAARAWHEQWDVIRAGCSAYYAAEKKFTSCSAHASSVCNPKNIETEQACIDDQLETNGPTRDDVQRLQEKAWSDRRKSGRATSNSILD